MPRDTSPTWCPARPTRCSPLATDGGVDTCTTRSTAPMSMPSSRLDVATTQRSRPDLRSSSMSARCSLLTEPWCARASTGSAPCPVALPPICCAGGRVGVGESAVPWRSAQASLRRAVSRSASPRELQNTMVERTFSTRSRRSCSTCGHMLAGVRSSVALGRGSAAARPPGSARLMAKLVMSSTGTVTSRERSDSLSGATMRTGARPPRNRATSSCGRTVALSPTRRAGCSSRSSSRSSERARWAPRLVPATAWISSTMTVSTSSSDSRAADVSIRNNDSGVVMRMSGGCEISRRRSCCGVSPERTPTVTSWNVSPRRAAAWVMPTRGERRLRSTSTASAFSGETYRTRVPSLRSAGTGGGSCRSRSMLDRNAARVLPEPVGATTRTWSPASKPCQAPTCAGVGAAKAWENHSRVAGAKRSRDGGTSRELCEWGTDMCSSSQPAVTGAEGTNRRAKECSGVVPE